MSDRVQALRVGLAKIIWLDNHPDTEKHWRDAPQEVVEHWLGVADKYLSFLTSQGLGQMIDGEFVPLEIGDE